MKFYVDKKADQYPCFVLEHNSWDDFNRKTSFNLSFYDSERRYENIGKIKIMHEEEYETIEFIPREFEELPDEFCSLGQSIHFYKDLKSSLVDSQLFYTVLDALNDMAFLPAVRDRFENNRNFKTSLLRFSEAEKAFHEAKRVLENLPIEQDFIFTYQCHLPNANGIHKVDFNFGDNEYLPNRIIGLIGKNGTGKTQFLAQLAIDLSGQAEKELIDTETFYPSRPLFSKVITVSYSAFDKFSRPQKDKSFSYKYCGLRDENDKLLTSTKLIKNYENAVKAIWDTNRHNKWYKIMNTIIGTHLADIFYEEIFENENFEIVDNTTSKLLSSGQSFLMYVITEILASIRENSLLLFDEPEMHLHPNAIANFIRMLDILLGEFDSYAVVATHSPIIIQEIPSRYIKVFDREGDVPFIRNLGLESFGENLDELTEEVFQTKDVKGTYKEVFEKLCKQFSYEEVLNLFENKLSLHSKTYLYNLYNNEES
ncbi:MULTISPECIES: AAA family ATPase [unclassified Chryseobacterium]|uniref:AAA family ATPase n=1 Tax=unclassified Chryseobacterium TaxID=2593645 RepID=UPI000D36E9E0|nr:MULTISPECIES: AAA family ATPase [unclassified Chryseobacterium]PTT75490.1 AAA family ATPase [Chryseobacterium sp. HMWF001]PVV50787.1 AAA family ATPase [Chryseobacterium sp. HMWF035]